MLAVTRCLMGVITRNWSLNLFCIHIMSADWDGQETLGAAAAQEVESAVLIRGGASLGKTPIPKPIHPSVCELDKVLKVNRIKCVNGWTWHFNAHRGVGEARSNTDTQIPALLPFVPFCSAVLTNRNSMSLVYIFLINSINVHIKIDLEVSANGRITCRQLLPDVSWQCCCFLSWFFFLCIVKSFWYFWLRITIIIFAEPAAQSERGVSPDCLKKCFFFKSGKTKAH